VLTLDTRALQSFDRHMLRASNSGWRAFNSPQLLMLSGILPKSCASMALNQSDLPGSGKVRIATSGTSIE
jgi:hypothetical protein